MDVTPWPDKGDNRMRPFPDECSAGFIYVIDGYPEEQLTTRDPHLLAIYLATILDWVSVTSSAPSGIWIRGNEFGTVWSSLILCPSSRIVDLDSCLELQAQDIRKGLESVKVVRNLMIRIARPENPEIYRDLGYVYHWTIRNLGLKISIKSATGGRYRFASECGESSYAVGLDFKAENRCIDVHIFPRIPGVLHMANCWTFCVSLRVYDDLIE